MRRSPVRVGQAAPFFVHCGWRHRIQLRGALWAHRFALQPDAPRRGDKTPNSLKQRTGAVSAIPSLGFRHMSAQASCRERLSPMRDVSHPTRVQLTGRIHKGLAANHVSRLQPAALWSPVPRADAFEVRGVAFILRWHGRVGLEHLKMRPPPVSPRAIHWSIRRPIVLRPKSQP